MIDLTPFDNLFFDVCFLAGIGALGGVFLGLPAWLWLDTFRFRKQDAADAAKAGAK